ncbi:MAG TPA: AAC(3) family N-acetyltransferase [Anaerolineales bacterium]|nr:AAC(3) family N-acetyltransferase [Anaerolineales bacterium]
MLDYPELKRYFDALNLADKPVIVHASLKPFGYIRDGADGVLRAMLGSFQSIVMPTFTYWTMVTPNVGPANNAMRYGKEETLNKQAASFRNDLPADSMMGILSEALRNHPMAARTSHPIFSFAGINAQSILDTQTLFDPLAPIAMLADQDGWVVLINTDHTSNTSIHYAEKLADRKQFTRWALTGDRVAECPSCPGDSSGFQALQPYIQPDVFRVEAGKASIEAMPLKRLLDITIHLIKTDPLALLCERTDCLECNAVRAIYAVG